jgi:hypothetical protein
MCYDRDPWSRLGTTIDVLQQSSFAIVQVHLSTQMRPFDSKFVPELSCVRYLVRLPDTCLWMIFEHILIIVSSS